MGRIINWDQVGTRLYEVGVDRGVLYFYDGDAYSNGVAWNGLTSVDADDEGHEITPMYSGDIKVDMLNTYDEFKGSIGAYTYPDEFEACLGSAEPIRGIYARQQSRSPFGLCYRSLIGNDINGQDFAYKLHLIYNMEVTGSSLSRSAINDNPDAVEFGFDFSALSESIDDYEPYAEVVIDSRRFSSESMEILEKILYGDSDDEESVPRLPYLDELIDLFYVPEPTPPEWEGYPFDSTYPSTNRYPYDPVPHDSDSLLLTSERTVQPGETRNGPQHASARPIIPEGAIPERYAFYFTMSDESALSDVQALTWNAVIDNNNHRITLSQTNNTTDPITIPANTTIRVVIYYTISEEGGES